MAILSRNNSVCIKDSPGACAFVGRLIDLHRRTEREYLAAAVVAPRAALDAAVVVDLAGADFVDTHLSALFMWVCCCGDRGLPFRVNDFLVTARAAGVDVDLEDLEFQFACDSIPRNMVVLAETVKACAKNRLRARRYFVALDRMAVAIEDRAEYDMDATARRPPAAFVPPRLRGRVVA